MIAFDFVAGLNFGILQEKQINDITQNLQANGYKSDIASPALLVYSKEFSQLVINPNQIIFKNQLNGNYSVDHVANIIIDALRGLFVSQLDLDATIRIAETLSNDEANAGEILNKFSTIKLEDIKGVKTQNVGYRFLHDFHGRLGEFKIEPLLQNTSLLYIEGIYNFNCNSFDSISITAELALSDFQLKKDYFIEKVKEASNV